MLTPIHHHLTNCVLGAPIGWTPEDGTCAALPVHHEYHATFEDTFTSYWSVPVMKRIAILLGCPIRLTVKADAHPVVSLEARND